MKTRKQLLENLRKLTVEDIKWTVTAETEWEEPEGHFCSGDDKQDAELVKSIKADLLAGNEWAWCCIKVTGTYYPLGASAYLGGCSYKSKEDFMQENGYYQDMQQEVLANLQDQVNQMVEHLTKE